MREDLRATPDGRVGESDWITLTADGILRRDLFVVGEIRRRGIPVVMLPSGGYTRLSYKLVADSVVRLLQAERE